MAAYAVLVVWYAFQAQYSDAAEPTIAAVATLFLNGQPVYHDVDSAERYSHMYGPMAFIIPGWCLSLLGKSIVASKAAGALAGLASVAVVFGLTCTRTRSRHALLLTGLYSAMCLMFQHVSFWNRPDSLALLIAGAALLVAVRVRSPSLSTMLLGLAAGILANVKMTGPLYLLPAFAVLASQRRIPSIVLAGFMAAMVAAIPFVLHENVSFSNYIAWTRTSAQNGLLFATLKQNLEWALFLLVPLVPSLLRSAGDPLERWVQGALVAGMLLVVLAASKPGAGPYHLLPFLPAIMYAASLTVRNAAAQTTRHPGLRRGAFAFLFSCALTACLQSSYFVWTVTRTPGAELAADLRRLVGAHPSDRIDMGYSAHNESFSYVRPMLVFHHGAYLFDAPAIQEYQMSNLDLPSEAVRALERCQVRTWLMPKDGEPFSLRNRYPVTGHARLFPDAFRVAFHDAYRLAGSTEYFDVWTCRAHVR